MWNFNGFIIICIICGCLISSTKGAGLFGSLLAETDNKNNRGTSPNIPFISSLGLRSNNREVNENINDDIENMNNDNANRGLLPLLGVNSVHKPIINNLNNNNHFTNTNPSSANKNVNDLKKQMAEAEKLLERLKEQQKLENEKNNQGKDNSGNKYPETANSNKTDVKGDGSVLKSLTKKQFFGIVQPVVPEDEAIQLNQTLYYYD